jgi:hypothetical protein
VSSEYYKAYHYAVSLIVLIHSLLNPNIFLSTQFCNTLSLCFSLNARDEISHPNKTQAKIVVPNILIFVFLDRKEEEKIFWTKW